jgi:hypothetical protein
MHSSSPCVLNALPISSSLTLPFYLTKITSYEAPHNILQPLIISSLFGPIILLSTLFSNILSLCSSLNEVTNKRTSLTSRGLLGTRMIALLVKKFFACNDLTSSLPQAKFLLPTSFDTGDDLFGFRPRN